MMQKMTPLINPKTATFKRIGEKRTELTVSGEETPVRKYRFSFSDIREMFAIINSALYAPDGFDLSKIFEIRSIVRDRQYKHYLATTKKPQEVKVEEIEIITE